MTNLQKQLGGISVNGRVRYFDRITDLKRAGRAAWTVVHKGTGGTGSWTALLPQPEQASPSTAPA